MNWHITVNQTTRTPDLIHSAEKQDTPTLTFMQGGVQFTAEFYNRSDYMAARDSNVDVTCIVVSKNRSKRVLGIARNLK